MNKIIFTAFIVLLFGLFVSNVHAEDMTSLSGQMVGTVNTDNTTEPETYVTEILNRGVDSDLPFVLQQDHKACVDKCSRDHTACISKVGNNPSAVNNCDEKRWRCTLSCDDKYYGSKTSYLFNRY